MNILFLCTSNLNRSKTAELYCQKKFTSHTFGSAGLSEKYCKEHGTTVCTEDKLIWADRVFVMEDMHLERIVEHTGDEFFDKITSLNIPDQYKFQSRELLYILKSRFASFPTVFMK